MSSWVVILNELAALEQSFSRINFQVIVARLVVQVVRRIRAFEGLVTPNVLQLSCMVRLRTQSQVIERVNSLSFHRWQRV